VTNVEIAFLIAVDDGSQVVRRGCPVAAVRIQCFDFASRGDATR
jgi:hypothetical protein